MRARGKGMIRVVALLALGALAGCGADGEPVQPTLDAVIGVSPNGTHAAGGLGLSKGPVSLFIGF